MYCSGWLNEEERSLATLICLIKSIPIVVDLKCISKMWFIVQCDLYISAIYIPIFPFHDPNIDWCDLYTGATYTPENTVLLTLMNWRCGLVVECPLCNRKTGVRFPAESDQRLLKMVPDACHSAWKVGLREVPCDIPASCSGGVLVHQAASHHRNRR